MQQRAYLADKVQEAVLVRMGQRGVEMPGPIDRWTKENEAEHGHYACFAGFEKEIRQHEILADFYEDLDVIEQTVLFSFVCRLIEEAEKG